MEVFLLRSSEMEGEKRLLHARGGVSLAYEYWEPDGGSSPRSWRCFSGVFPYLGSEIVFSTLVEVFPEVTIKDLDGVGLLHARGGVSVRASASFFDQRSSPRSWRCFPEPKTTEIIYIVFSTLVEVFLAITAAITGLTGLLHARGGVSYDLSNTAATHSSSPRSWRCFF